MQNRYYPFTSFKAYPAVDDCLKYRYVWEIDPTFQDKAPFEFSVQAAETPDFSELICDTQAGNNFSLSDLDLTIQGMVANISYRAKLVTGSDKTYYSAIINQGAQTESARSYTIAREIMRKECVRFKYAGRGQKGWIVKRKNYGLLNTSNLDPISNVPINALHTSDLGTARGYYNPLLITYSQEDLKTNTQMSQEGYGTINTEQLNIRMLGFPLVNPFDILVKDDGMRFQFINTDITWFPGADIPLIQQCTLNLLPPTDVIYSIPVI